jgi:hypothetical protein
MAAAILAFLFGKDWTNMNTFLTQFAPQTKPMNQNRLDNIAIQQTLQSLIDTGQIAVQGSQQYHLGAIDTRCPVDQKTKFYDLTNHNIVAKRLK